MDFRVVQMKNKPTNLINDSSHKNSIGIIFAVNVADIASLLLYISTAPISS